MKKLLLISLVVLTGCASTTPSVKNSVIKNKTEYDAAYFNMQSLDTDQIAIIKSPTSSSEIDQNFTIKLEHLFSLGKNKPEKSEVTLSYTSLGDGFFQVKKQSYTNEVLTSKNTLVSYQGIISMLSQSVTLAPEKKVYSLSESSLKSFNLDFSDTTKKKHSYMSLSGKKDKLENVCKPIKTVAASEVMSNLTGEAIYYSCERSMSGRSMFTSTYVYFTQLNVAVEVLGQSMFHLSVNNFKNITL
ncbi:MAG: hypothetical protein HRU38_22675 [Saccharospirillaceae bacterium]|nr:hypothetical protein [Pseudomonadales bacterium]NRB81431.1 hypothetical protein [Saccharospirillaceae bacterium]